MVAAVSSVLAALFWGDLGKSVDLLHHIRLIILNMIQLAGDHIDLTDYLLNLLVQGAEDIQRGTQLLVLLMDLTHHNRS